MHSKAAQRCIFCVRLLCLFLLSAAVVKVTDDATTGAALGASMVPANREVNSVVTASINALEGQRKRWDDASSCGQALWRR